MISPAISIKQPWAWAILNLGKDVENRTWDLPCKFRGATVLLHTGKSLDRAGYRWLVEQGFALPHDVELPVGGIVGALTFKRHIIPGPRSPWAEPGMHWWPIASAWPLEYFPCKGSLGFFTVDYPHEVRL
jgi:hypothetical protein